MDRASRSQDADSEFVSARAGVGQAGEQAVMLDLVRRRGASTRPVLARDTGLSRAVVTQRLADLLSSGLIVETGSEVSGGGRPPRQLQFNAKLGHVLVADLGATSIDVALADLSGAILCHRAEDAEIGAGPEAILGRVEALFDDMGAAVGALPGRLWGIGIGVPGPVEFSTARPVAPPIMPGWDGYPIRDRFSDRYGAAVWVDNDVNVMALGERAEGVGRGTDDLLFIKVGTGIGAGIISHGELQRGAQGSAGDVGHIQVVSDPAVVCRCSKIGCLEAVAGGAALARAAMRAVTNGDSPQLADLQARGGSLSARDIIEAARFGDPTSIQFLRQAGLHIGQMLATAVNLLNPSLIVIGGGLANAGDVLIAGVREVVYARSLPLATRHLRIQQSSLGDRAGVVGLAVMVLDQLFAPERVMTWIDAGLTAGRPEAAVY